MRKPQVKELAEDIRYMEAGEELLTALMQIARERNVCPWCLLVKTYDATGRAMEAGDIDHREGVMH